MIKMVPASLSSLEEIADLEKRAFARPGEDFEPNVGIWKDWIRSAYTHCLVTDDQIVGVAVAVPESFQKYKIEMLFIDPDYQRCGLATMMLQEILDRCDKENAVSCLDVRSERTGAIQLYQSMGFRNETDTQGSHYDANTFTFMARPPQATL